MVIETNENIVCIDVDETLVLWTIPPGRGSDCIMFNSFGVGEWLLPHEHHIKLLKQFKVRGHKVIVWSQGGPQWAAEVVRVLKLEDYVDVVMAKPKWIIDDLPASQWTARTYLDIDGNRTVCKDAIASKGDDDTFPWDEK